jgi:hypothetical protein
LKEKTSGTKINVENIGNGHTTDVSLEKTETKENKEHVYERRDVDDSKQIHGKTNGKKICRRDLRRIKNGVTSVCNS